MHFCNVHTTEDMKSGGFIVQQCKQLGNGFGISLHGIKSQFYYIQLCDLEEFLKLMIIQFSSFIKCNSCPTFISVQ